MKDAKINVQIAQDGEGGIRIEDESGAVVLLNAAEAVVLRDWMGQAGIGTTLNWREEDEE